MQCRTATAAAWSASSLPASFPLVSCHSRHGNFLGVVFFFVDRAFDIEFHLLVQLFTRSFVELDDKGCVVLGTQDDMRMRS